MSVCVYTGAWCVFFALFTEPPVQLFYRNVAAPQDLLFFQRTLCTRTSLRAHLVCKASIRRSELAAEDGGSARERERALAPLASSDVGDKP